MSGTASRTRPRGQMRERMRGDSSSPEHAMRPPTLSDQDPRGVGPVDAGARRFVLHLGDAMKGRKLHWYWAPAAAFSIVRVWREDGPGWAAATIVGGLLLAMFATWKHRSDPPEPPRFEAKTRWAELPVQPPSGAWQRRARLLNATIAVTFAAWLAETVTARQPLPELVARGCLLVAVCDADVPSASRHRCLGSWATTAATRAASGLHHLAQTLGRRIRGRAQPARDPTSREWAGVVSAPRAKRRTSGRFTTPPTAAALSAPRWAAGSDPEDAPTRCVHGGCGAGIRDCDRSLPR